MAIIKQYHKDTDPNGWASFCDKLYETNWVGHIVKTFHGNGNAIEYLARYTFRTAISDSPGIYRDTVFPWAQLHPRPFYITSGAELPDEETRSRLKLRPRLNAICLVAFVSKIKRNKQVAFTFKFNHFLCEFINSLPSFPVHSYIIV